MGATRLISAALLNPGDVYSLYEGDRTRTTVLSRPVLVRRRRWALVQEPGQDPRVACWTPGSTVILHLPEGI